MAAPALIALAHGSRDPRSASTISALVDEVRAMRPDLRVAEAFLDLSSPDFHQVVDSLVREGHDEIVAAPPPLPEPSPAKGAPPAVIAEATERHPSVKLRATAVLGHETRFLEIIDERLRSALKKAR